MIGISARRLLARAVGYDRVDYAALAQGRQVFGSWRRLGEVLKQEKLANILGYRLAQAESIGDAGFRRFLRAQNVDTLAWALKLRREFEVIRRAMACEGIPVLPIKGVDVGFSVYPTPGARPLTDVDILVSPDNYLAAQEILKTLGFSPLKREPRWWPGRSFYKRGGMVDLHWSPAAALPPRRGMASLCYVTGREEDIKEEFRLLVCVCHLQNHFFSLPLLYYLETALLARRVTWSNYWPLARAWGAARATRYALSLSSSLFGGGPAIKGFSVLNYLAGPGFDGESFRKGFRAAAVYAASLDNPASALFWAFRKPAWAHKVITQSPFECDY